MFRSQLSATITQRVILIILVMIVIVPIVLYNATDHTDDYSTAMFHLYQTSANISTVAKEKAIEILMDKLQRYDGQTYLLELKMNPYVDGNWTVLGTVTVISSMISLTRILCQWSMITC
jgi:hypothetical protein